MTPPVGNPLKKLCQEEATAIGGWCQLPTASAAEIMGQLGFDWVCVDQQHGSMNLETAGAMLQAISIGGSVPFVRVPANDAAAIGKALDLGAFGVIVPAVNSAEEAAIAARACRYPPLGIRSAGPIRISSSFGSDIFDWNDYVLCFAMIESRDGWENLEAICATPGVDGIYVGPMDLALGRGRAPSMDSLDEADIERIVAASHQHDVVLGIHASSGAEALRRRQQGFRLIAIASDEAMLVEGAKRELQAVGVPGGRRRHAPASLVLQTSTTYGAWAESASES
jgi:4-hydroxy-2-oxoheptanedioate aldolase